MKKSDVVSRVADRTGLSRGTAENTVNSMLAAMGEAPARGEVARRSRISGFGRFSVRTRPAHTGRNPGTGEPTRVGVSKTPLFRAGKRLKETVN